MTQEMAKLTRYIVRAWATFNGTVLFYTRLPLPKRWPAEFANIAKLVPWIGVGLGAILSGVDRLLAYTDITSPLRSALVVMTGVWLTGGLHLDGAMDTGDGLAVQNADQRLSAMADSRTGAFGVMVAISIVLLKTLALDAITHHRWFALLSAAAWGRWGQQWAIGRYPYLKPNGKGAFHQQAIPSFWQSIPAAVGLAGMTLLAIFCGWISWSLGLVASGSGIATAWLLSAWLHHRLGGHTGDTYGAMVEWGEVAVLVSLSAVY